MQANKNNFSVSFYYSIRFESFLNLLAKAKDLSEESIHEIRVDIKKLRSLLLVLEELGIEEDPVSKLLKQLRPVFKASGKLRTLQLGNRLLNEFPLDIPLAMESLLEVKKTEVSEEVNAVYEKFNLLKFEKRVNRICIKLEQLQLNELVAKLEEIIQDQLKLILKIWNSSYDLENLHQLRKYFKIEKTLLQFLIEINDNEELQKSLNLVNKIESKLGLWHDYEVFDQRMLDYKNQFPDADYRKFFRELKFWKREEKLMLLNEVKALMKEFS
ncbi:CHAD domain-containing protein [Ancylomarina longa]|uniref:CHAD domain-containing protein n=1 Tax=Ancylomarina longa TaxID=2487017 RepID=A0A434AXB5_9BACT|nr:CHAD domain-containing protein [Ancylomarina longa]RUT79171.1 CHAD domain-containing protein [Ancylomarina longa]